MSDVHGGLHSDDFRDIALLAFQVAPQLENLPSRRRMVFTQIHPEIALPHISTPHNRSDVLTRRDRRFFDARAR